MGIFLLSQRKHGSTFFARGWIAGSSVVKPGNDVGRMSAGRAPVVAAPQPGGTHLAIIPRKATRRIAPPTTLEHARRHADNRIGSAASFARTVSRPESGATALSATTTRARRPRRGATPYRNSNRGTAFDPCDTSRSALATDKIRPIPPG